MTSVSAKPIDIIGVQFFTGAGDWGQRGNDGGWGQDLGKVGDIVLSDWI